MMTNWKQIKKLAGPNPEVFPGGEKVYLFCSLARLQPPWCSEDIRPWLRQFAAEAGANGLETEVRKGHVYVIVPHKADKG